MKYLSLFSGIGGFEIAIHQVFPEAECLGYSEVKPSAIKVYEQHFSGHNNLGDITKITKEKIEELVKNGCDLIVGGFPCTNLSAISRISPHVNNNGLQGEKSSLFYEMLRIVKIIRDLWPKCAFIFENNATMRIKERDTITDAINNACNPVYMTKIDNADFGVQIRKRLFWTSFPVEISKNDCIQSWEEILDPIEDTISSRCSDHILDGYMNGLVSGSNYGGNILISVKTTTNARKFILLDDKHNNKSSRIQSSFVSDTCIESQRPYPIGKSRPILGSSLPANIVLDRRDCNLEEFIPRYFTPNEIHRLMGFEPNWVCGSMSTIIDLLGNAVCVPVIVHLVTHL